MADPIGIIFIDERETEIFSGETILSVARRVGVEIPTLCFLEGKTRLESCGICMVEVEGHTSTLPACASLALPGMTVHTDTPTLREGRRMALELLLSDHLGDCQAPCELACPADIDIPGFIRSIRDGRHLEALEVIHESTPFAGVLGRICPRFCERVCRRAQIDEAISICALKRYPADHERIEKTLTLPQKSPPTGKRVAIIGAGIVGLTAAYYLLRRGHECTLHEAGSRPGGALTSIIPEFRLPSEIVDCEIERIQKLGAKILCNSALGKDLSLDDIRKDADAVLLAIGATRTVAPEFPGSDLARSSLAFLQEASQDHSPKESLGASLVIGSGPTALDTCRTLLRFGSEKVMLAMKPSLEASLFFKTWIPDAVAEGIEIIAETDVEGLEECSEGHCLCRLSRDGQEKVVKARYVFLAESVEPDKGLLESLALATTRQGVRVDRRTLATSLEGVFAAGNIAQAGRYAVHGSAAGRHAAESICRYLEGDDHQEKKTVNVRMHELSEDERELLFAGFPEVARAECERELNCLPTGDFSEIDRGLREEDAIREASRCLQCDCAAKKDCDLRNQATEYGANPHAFGGDRPPFERDTSHEDVVYESGKCIKCGRCIAIAEERGAPLGLSYIGRGFRVKVAVPFDESIQKGLREAALACAEACPTGALAKRPWPKSR